MTLHIQVVTEDDEKPGSKYLIHHLTAYWEEQGHRVTFGPTRRLDADLGIMHIDRTWLPPACIPGNPGRRPLLNASVLDISKRRFSRNLLSPDSDFTGPVIVKTDANSFGKRDRHQLPALPLGSLRRRLAAHGYWKLARLLPPKDYPLYERLSDVPDWIWKRGDLVVEKFLPERSEEGFSLRVWMFLGEHDYSARLFSRHPIVKTGNICRFEYIHDVPDVLREARADLGIDYAKFDYVVVNGEPSLLDINTTPTVHLSRPRSENVRHLAAGLSGYTR